ncbi:MAG: hypothetical protein JWO06_4059 [Bacteroidota bacterium]|nr:hypothetical protein [Bacteroidota bacterium]
MDWSTTKTIVSNSNLEVKDSLAPYLGLSSIHIVTGHADSPIDTLSGYVHYGPSGYENGQLVMSNVPFPCRPDSLQFAYKYIPVGGDVAAVGAYFGLAGSGSGSNYFIDVAPLPATNTYQVITLGFFGDHITVPDSLNLTFTTVLTFYTLLITPVQVFG